MESPAPNRSTPAPSGGSPPTDPCPCRIEIGRHQQSGREHYGELDLSLAAFGPHVTRLTRGWHAGDGASLCRAIAGLRGADLYLASACEHDRPPAWPALRAAFRTRLIGLAIKRGVRRAEADDLVDDTVADLSIPPPAAGYRTGIGTFTGRGALFAFLATVLVRRHADRVRAALRRREDASGDAAPEARTDPDSPTPLDASLGLELAERVQQAVATALARCTPRERLVLVLKYRDGVSQKRIAALLGIGEPRVSRLMEQAVSKAQSIVPRELGDAEGITAANGSAWSRVCEAVRRRLAIDSPDERLPRVPERKETE